MDKFPDEICFEIVDNLHAANDYYHILSSRSVLKNGTIARFAPDYVDFLDKPQFFHSKIRNESSIVTNSLASLASTSKRLRRIALPTMFRSLTFCGLPELEGRGAYHYATSGLVILIRTYLRVKSLSRLPHCLRHVQELSLLSWQSSHRSLAYLWEEWELEGRGSEPFHMFAEVYKMVTGLVSHMPQLRTLVMVESEFPLRLHHDLSRLPYLSSLDVSTPYPTSSPLEITSMPRIRHLRYDNPHYDPHGSFLEHILPFCIDDLESLEINGVHLLLLASYVQDRTLSLKSLCIAFSSTPRLYEAPTVWVILQACPKLRCFVIGGNAPNVPNVESPNISLHHLPKLTTIWAPYGYLRELTEGRQIDTVIMRHPEYFGLVADILRGHVAHLQRITVHPMFRTPLELLQFVDFFRPFENLVRISIVYLMHGARSEEGINLELRDGLVNGLQALKRLDHCTIANTADYHCAEDVGCPIGTERDCDHRGHPALTTIMIDFFSPHLWVWENRLGWTRKELIADNEEDA